MQIDIKASKNYTCHIERGLLYEAGKILSEQFGPRRVCIVTDKTVEALYSSDLEKRLSGSGFAVSKFVIEGGESSKTLTVAESLLDFMAEMGFTRNDLVVALGGGVVGDLAGFAASMYMRGIEYVQIPTTVLAAVDSSVGGKTAVNLSEGKNLAGAFWQPSLVLCDPDTFLSLPKDVFAAGLAEAIKCSVIADRFMFDDFEIGSYDIEEVVAKCIAIKARIVEEDETEQGRRMLLNLGHTVGHAIEKASAYEISHGDAVAIGLYTVSKASGNKRLTDRIYRVLTINGLPWRCSIEPEEILPQIALDKKRRGNKISIIVPLAAGRCEIREMSLDEAKEFLAGGFKN